MAGSTSDLVAGAQRPGGEQQRPGGSRSNLAAREGQPSVGGDCGGGPAAGASSPRRHDLTVVVNRPLGPGSRGGFSPGCRARDNAGVEPVPGTPGPATTGGPGQPFVPDPPRGRVFTTARAVRGTDVTPAGRLRFDALARYLQDAAQDDLADAGWDEPYGWLLRRCEVAVREYPASGQQVAVRTFCSASGPRWAERTTTLSGPSGDLVQARAIWVAITRADGRPARWGQPSTACTGLPPAGGRCRRGCHIRDRRRRKTAGPGHCGPPTSTRRAT